MKESHPKKRYLPRIKASAVVLGVAVLCLTASSCPEVYDVRDRHRDRDLEIIWPRNGASLRDEELFRVRLRGRNFDDYEVYWYVDDSRERQMWNDRESGRREKVYLVDTWFWDWRGRGPYTVGFTAEDRRGRTLAHRTVRVYVR